MLVVNPSSGEHIYPRHELADEYRRHSGARSLRPLNLHQLLKEMKVPETIVEVIRSSEKEDACRLAARNTFRYRTDLGCPFRRAVKDKAARGRNTR